MSVDAYLPVIPPEVKDVKVLFITGNHFNDIEAYYPYYRFVEAGYQVTIASPEGGEIRGQKGHILSNTVKITDVYPRQSDFLYLPGGHAPEHLKKNEKVLEAVREFETTGQLICAICHGVQILAAADLIRDKKVTCPKDVIPEVEKAGGKYEDNAVIVDSNLITSRGPGDLPLQLRAIISHVESLKEAYA